MTDHKFYNIPIKIPYQTLKALQGVNCIALPLLCTSVYNGRTVLNKYFRKYYFNFR